MADDEMPTLPDATVVANAEPSPAAAPKKAVRTKKASTAMGRPAAPAPAKPKVRGLSDEEKRRMIADIDVQVSGGMTLKDAVKAAGISDQTYYQWKKAVHQPPAPSISPAASIDDEFAEFIQLEEENRRLRKLLSEKLRAENADLRKRLGLN